MVIASVSFGQVRSFDIRNKANHQEHYSVKLAWLIFAVEVRFAGAMGAPDR
ncbi:hypothetical protein [Mucilaginibacter auburnensis]|uniref:hypothetical protein n=1 Tax=Mucilaginibacter auburnensis TaxID=1457233 RepID=UPI001FE497E9|nr:hypothetical protein [Mucilaginibacter auburnensis]